MKTVLVIVNEVPENLRVHVGQVADCKADILIKANGNYINLSDTTEDMNSILNDAFEIAKNLPRIYNDESKETNLIPGGTFDVISVFGIVL